MRVARIIVPPVVSAALLVLCFPRYDMHYLAWVALVPFFYALRGASKFGRFAAGYLFGLVFLGGLLYWITEVRYPAVIGYAIGIPAFSFMFAFYGLFAGSCLNRRESYLAIALPAAAWVSLEYLFSLGPLAFPWWAVGYSQSLNLPAAQAAAWGGVYAVSFLVLLANTAVVVAAADWRRRQLGLVVAAVVVFGALMMGFVSLSSPAGGDQRVKLAVVQAGFTQEEKETPDVFATMYREHLEMTRRAVARHAPDMVVWSETVADYPWLAGEQTLPWTMFQLGDMGIHLVAGVYERRDGKDYNTVIAISPEDGVIGSYSKMHLVPFGEYVPLRELLSRSPAAKKWIDEAIYPIDTHPGEKMEVFETRRGKFSAVICFESTLQQISRDAVKKGAELLMVLTNDAWFGRSSAAHQHAAMAVFRGIENRRYIVQGANSGVSLIADPYGRRIAESGLMTKEIIHGDVFFRSGRSVYNKVGDMFSWLCLAFSVAGAALVYRGRGKRKPKPKPEAKKKKKSGKKKKKKKKKGR